MKNNAKILKKTFRKNNSKNAYQLVKELTSSKQERTTTIHDKGNCLTEEQSTLWRWTEYCSELYTHTTTGDPKVLHVPPSISSDSYPILG